MRVARVAVDGAAYHFDREYSYLVPQFMVSSLLPGCRVRVGFGRGNKPRLAVVLALDEAECHPGLKEILSQIDDAPLIDADGIALLRYLKEQTFCTWFDALRLLIPTGLGVVFQTLYGPAKEAPLTLDPVRLEIMGHLKKRGQPSLAGHLAGRFFVDEPFLEQMAAEGFLERLERSKNRVLDDKIIMARLLPGWEELPLTARQKQVAAFLEENDSASLKELCYYTGVTRVVAEGLRKKGAIEFYDQVIARNPYPDKTARDTAAVALSDEQRSALGKLVKALDTPEQPALLYGVTGSGKTQVYLALIEEVLAKGKRVIVLIPEISLTAQTLECFHARFGGRVAVLHSGLSLGERMDEWRRVESGAADIVIGTRSAVFAPVKRLGLIVIDEEQEHTYKSDKSPRYHARDVARLRCKQHGALLLLASATPAVESYHAAKTGQYSLVELPRRFGTARLPDVQIVDMRDAEQLTETPSLSVTLREALYHNLTHGEQSILLLNRRGHSTLVRCSSCGAVAECPNCSVTMTYHTANDALLCHYCGYQIPRIKSCAHCGSELVRYAGTGTQKLEEEIATAFPDARILRVDMDTTMSKFSHERLFSAFSAGEYDIMIGTQMVAKGLNFPKVTLVGVVATDQSLYANDFRSFERTFSLLTQVVGRCGRAELKGRAIIQTFSPDNPIIQLAAGQNYPDFFTDEDYNRKIHLYPPYCRMAGIGFIAASDQLAMNAAQAFLSRLTALAEAEYSCLPLRVLGPSPANVHRAAGKFRYKLILKCKNNPETRQLLVRMLEWFYSEIKHASIFIDMHYDGI